MKRSTTRTEDAGYLVPVPDAQFDVARLSRAVLNLAETARFTGLGTRATPMAAAHRQSCTGTTQFLLWLEAGIVARNAIPWSDGQIRLSGRLRPPRGGLAIRPTMRGRIRNRNCSRKPKRRPERPSYDRRSASRWKPNPTSIAIQDANPSRLMASPSRKLKGS